MKLFLITTVAVLLILYGQLLSVINFNVTDDGSCTDCCSESGCQCCGCVL